MEPSRRGSSGVLISVVIHGGIFACLVLLGVSSRARLTQPSAKTIDFVKIAQVEVAGASHSVTLNLPPNPSAAHTKTPDPNKNAAKLTPPVERPHPPQKDGGGTPPSPHNGDGLGQAATGSGPDAENATMAFPIFSPKPPVKDRSLLPGSEKKIVVDVNIDASGGVVEETLITGIGNQLDQLVLDTVKSWRFQPATVNGKPVPTQAELVFPFNPQYPLADS